MNDRASPARLRVLIAASVLAIQLGTFAIIALGMHRDVVDEVRRHAEDDLVGLSDTLAERAMSYLSPAEDAIESMQHLVEGQVVDTGDDAELEVLFLSLLHAKHSLAAVYFGRPDGTFMSVQRGSDDLRVMRVSRNDDDRVLESHWLVGGATSDGARDDAVNGFDPRARPWYHAAALSSGVIWTDPYPFFQTTQAGITSAVALHDEQGVFLGVIGIDIDLAGFDAFVGALRDERGAVAAIVSRNGSVVASTAIDGLTAESGQLPDLLELPNPLIEAFDMLGRASPSERTGLDRIKTLSDADGESVVLARKLPLLDGQTTWALLSHMPERLYLVNLQARFGEHVRTIALALTALGIIGITLTWKITAPVVKLHQDATVDSLTGALTRKAFDSRFRRLANVTRESRRDDQLVLVALDLDGFKQVNDVHGHAAGDEVLREITRRICSKIRSTDVVGRLGGDEFVVAMTLASGADVLPTIERLRSGVVAKPIRHGKLKLQIGVTAGIATLGESNELDALLMEADHALVGGKRTSKGRCYLAAKRNFSVVSAAA